MSQGRLKIHSENILPIIKRWLYSEKDIFLRELVSNSCDAIKKIKILRDHGEVQVNDEELRIDVEIDKEQRLLRIRDTGIGMTADEVERYIAEVAFSGAEEFVKKYRSDKEEDQIIGHFGLGFFSSYMVADRVEIQTLSYQKEAQAVFWSCDGTTQYTMDRGNRSTRGTEVILYLNKDSDDYLQEATLRRLLNHYCSFLPYPIFLNNDQINKQPPLWIKAPSECTEEDYLAFYRHLYPLEEEPLLWIHLNVDYPFHLKGILYFPRVRRDFDMTKSHIKLFCNRVFVSEDCKELLPEYLMVLRGAIDSPDIPLNVSRSYLQTDRTVQQLATHIAKKVADRLVSLYTSERDQFLKIWPDVEIPVKLGAMHDDKFYERVKECLIWKNIQGEWTTAEEYLERNRSQHENRLFYTGDERHQPPFLQLYREKGVEVLYTNAPIDTHFLTFIERKIPSLTSQRIDGALDDVILDGTREKGLLDAEGKSEATRIAEFVKSVLALDSLEVEAKSLVSDSVPAVVVLDEQMRRMRDYLALSHPKGGIDPLANKGRKLIVNTNSKLLSAIRSLHSKDPQLAQEMLHQVYDQALLSQREMKSESIDAFVQRNSIVLEKLSQWAVSLGDKP